MKIGQPQSTSTADATQVFVLLPGTFLSSSSTPTSCQHVAASP